MIYPTHPRYRPLRSARRSIRLIGGGVVLAGLFLSTAVAVPPPAAPRPAAPGVPTTAPARHGTRIPNATKVAPAAPPAAVLNAAILPEVAMLSHPDPKVQSDARKFLAADATPVGGPPAPAFQNGFGATLNTAILPLFKNPDARVRLNAAIVLANVSAQFDQTTTLSQAITAALNDSSEGVVLWGLKAARGVTPLAIGLPANVRPNQMFDGILRATRTYPASDAIIEEASKAIAENQSIVAPNAPPLRLQNAVPYILMMFEDRIDQYRAVQVVPGVDPIVPPVPNADSYSIFFLSGAGYGVATPADKKRITRDLLDLGKELARITPAMPPKAVGGPIINRDDMGGLLGRGVGGALAVIAGKEAKPASAAKATALQKLNGNSQPTLMEATVQELDAALAADGILGAERPTKPATAPAAPATPAPAAAKPVAAAPK